MKDVLVAIDPGIKAIGVAFFTHRTTAVEDEELPELLHCEVVTPSRGMGKHDAIVRVMDMHKRIEDTLREEEWRCAAVAVEYAEYRGSAVGHAAVVRGDVGDLCMAAGVHIASLRQMYGIHWSYCRLVPVSEWKGQLSKDVTTRRIHAVLGPRAINGAPIESHGADAVGIGCHVQGLAMTDDRMSLSRKGSGRGR